MGKPIMLGRTEKWPSMRWINGSPRRRIRAGISVELPDVDNDLRADKEDE